MIILHGALVDERLYLWGETPNESASVARGSRSRKASAAEPYPYDAGVEAVARAARELPINFRPTARRKAQAIAWLPTQGDQPLASSALIAQAPSSKAKLRVAPWKVEGISLDAGEGLEVLAGYGERAERLHGIVGGPDLRFWVRALRLAGSLVARQRYLPGVGEEDDKVHARWQPVWITEDARYLEELAESMPPVARALSSNGADAPQTAPVVTLRGFVGKLVDHIVRSHVDPAIEESGSASTPTANGNGLDATVHDRWLNSLRSPTAAVRGDAKEVANLADQVREWRKPLDAAVRAPFRLCFRLEEPSPPKDEAKPKRGRGRRNNGRNRPRETVRPGQRRWYVRYLLQGTDDPTLIVPTADAWITRGRKAAALSRSGTDVHHTLLLSLAQAAGVCPRIEASLRSRKPSGYSLDARGAHEFLADDRARPGAGGLRDVMLPDWWTEHGTDGTQPLGTRARARRRPCSEIEWEPSLDELAHLRLGDVRSPAGHSRAATSRRLARLKEPLQ